MKIFKKFCGLIAAVAAVSAPEPAKAQVVQPVYTRPSKGSALVVFNTANPSGTETSAVYDMSAFAEVQLDVTVTQTGGVTSTQGFNVSQLGRYIKIQAVYETLANDRAAIYTVLGSDSPAGTFVPLDGPGSLQVIRPNPSLAMTNAKLVMTPLPYSTTQYTRPSKGESITVLNTTLGQFTPVFPNTPVIDMRGFASISIAITFGGPLCAYGLNVFVYGGSTTVEADMRTVTTSNSVRPAQETTAYVVNTAADYIVIGGSVFASGVPGGVDCSVNVVATPLPYNIPNDAFSRTAKAATIYNLGAGGADVTIGVFERYQVLRLQNLGAGSAACGPSSVKPIELAAETVQGNGGVVTLNNYGGAFYCNANGGVATQIGVLNY